MRAVAAVLVVWAIASMPATADAATAKTPSGQPVSFDASISRYAPSKGISTRAVKVELAVSFVGFDGANPSDFSSLTFALPDRMTVHQLQFPSCLHSTLVDNGAKGCPKGSKVGGGTLNAQAIPIVPQFSAPLAAVSSRTGTPSSKQRRLALYASPTIGPNVLTEAVWADSGDWSLRVPGPNSGLVMGVGAAVFRDFTVSLGAVKRSRGHRRSGYLELPLSCKGTLKFEASVEFVNGEKLSVPVSVPCPT